MTTPPRPGQPAQPDRQEPPGRLDEADLAMLLLIRHFEQALLRLFADGEIDGTTHTCLGQEYIPVALRPLLGSDDYVFSNHRGHGHYLARFDDPDGLLAEIMGRRGAVCGGFGGSQHILRDRYLSTGVQGESLPVAVGVARHLKAAEPGRLAAVHIGDGTWGQGVVYEALNIAALWGVPLLVVVEHNDIAQSTPTRTQLAGTIAGRAAAFGIEHHATQARDVAGIRAWLAPVVERVRSTPRPVVVEFHTDRLGPHSKGDDTRSPEELDRLRRRDWYETYAAAYPQQFAAADERQRDLVAEVVHEVSARPPVAREDR
ncbi:thiamine pyrophosphate-dependent dehydrogenase E1 component subunit alpha [Polymorphospora sp. NPDC051019]|uniref:thiamine pyrophosphate-dependent dehydrogenase E1 component subunit alpha n=1 Tax=Polymorphospora sp. NPDC051019 TaxID=3155725 RepID=UPI00343CAFB9